MHVISQQFVRVVNYLSVDVDSHLNMTTYASEQFWLQGAFCPCDVGLQLMDYFIGVPSEFYVLCELWGT